MAYWEERFEIQCIACDHKNYVVAVYAGDGRTNEAENVSCFNCAKVVASRDCALMISAGSATAVTTKLKKAQNKQ